MWSKELIIKCYHNLYSSSREPDHNLNNNDLYKVIQSFPSNNIDTEDWEELPVPVSEQELTQKIIKSFGLN